MTTDWTAGVVRHGVSDPTPAPYRYTWRDGACAEYRHPGLTYHPQMDQTWCQCGQVTHPGNRLDWDHKHPASPLRQWWDDDARDHTIQAWAADGVPIPDYTLEG